MNQDAYGNFTDCYGTVFRTVDNTPPTANAAIEIVTGTGTNVSGSWVGSAVENK